MQDQKSRYTLLIWLNADYLSLSDFLCLRCKPPIISVRSDFSSVQVFIVIQIADRYRSYRNDVSTFSFSSKRKSRHPYLSKFSQVCTQIYTHLRKSDVFLDLWFEENENLNTKLLGVSTSIQLFNDRNVRILSLVSN